MTVLAAFSSASATGVGRYLHWGVISISLSNFSIIVAMIVLFVLALVIPFGRHHQQSSVGSDPENDSQDGGTS
jgi:hypothetical protein